MIDWTYSPRRDVPAKIKRRMTQWRSAAPAKVSCQRPVVTFTFDDFPKSAVRGADIVETHGGHAGFYACTSMMGKSGPMGDMFTAEDLLELASRGHEIGAHTHSHLDCAQSDKTECEQDISENLAALKEAGFEHVVSALAYPYGETQFVLKEQLASQFLTGRGVLPGLNSGVVDRLQLRAVELDQSDISEERAFAMLEKAVETNAWLIYFSHDVSDEPTNFGASPDLIEKLCQRAVDLGAVLAAPTRAAALAGISQ